MSSCTAVLIKNAITCMSLLVKAPNQKRQNSKELIAFDLKTSIL